MVVKTSAIGKCNYYCFEFFQPRREFIEIYREPFFPTCISFRKQTWKTTMSLRKKYGEQAKKMGTLYFCQGIPHSEAHIGRIGSIPTLSNVQEHIQGGGRFRGMHPLLPLPIQKEEQKCSVVQSPFSNFLLEHASLEYSPVPPCIKIGTHSGLTKIIRISPNCFSSSSRLFLLW